MTGTNDRQVFEAMILRGGSFVSKLGEAGLKADPNNVERIKKEFPEYWRIYEEIVKKEAK